MLSSGVFPHRCCCICYNASVLECTNVTLLQTYNFLQGVLNKLTPQKYAENWERLHDVVLEYTELDLIERIVNFVFEKAIAEPNFSDMYADLCRDMSNFSNSLSNPSPTEPQDSRAKLRSPFRKALLTRCQREFERKREAEDDVDEYRMRMRAVGAIKFIGELFMRYVEGNE